MTITVLHNQSLLDVMLQHTGSLASIFDVAMANGLSITSDLTPGQLLEIPKGVETDKDILNYYAAKKVQPATAIAYQPQQKAGGISIWAIKNEFIVQ